MIDFKAFILNMLKELNKTIITNIKDEIIAMSHQIMNISILAKIIFKKEPVEIVQLKSRITIMKN